VDPVEPPTLEELRAKLAQHLVDAQGAELRREIRRIERSASEERDRAREKTDAT
jgi:hypothetical protein